MSPIELVATLLGLTTVYLTIIRNIWLFPTGIAMVVLYAIVFYQARLYSDAGLQLVYVALQGYGWWAWLHGGPERDQLAVTRLTGSQLLAWTAAALVGGVLWGLVMRLATNAAFPIMDALIVSGSLVAQWLLSRKKVESWYFWIAIDVLALIVYPGRGLYLTAALYAVFLIMATLGLVRWHRDFAQRACPDAIVV